MPRALNTGHGGASFWLLLRGLTVIGVYFGGVQGAQLSAEERFRSGKFGCGLELLRQSSSVGVLVGDELYAVE